MMFPRHSVTWLCTVGIFFSFGFVFKDHFILFAFHIFV